MNTIQARVNEVRERQQKQWLWHCTANGMITGGMLGCATALLRVATHAGFGWYWVPVSVFTPVVASMAYALSKSKSEQSAARLIDHECQLKDRVQTALQFLASPSGDSVRRLQIEDTEAHLSAIDVQKIAPVAEPKMWRCGLVSSVVAMFLIFVATPAQPLQAGEEGNAVVAEQADRAAESLAELEQFQKEEADPELEKLLKEMNKELKGLKEHSGDPKEALAKLSAMEAELQAMQQQLQEQSSEATLKEIGEALSLSESMQSAGEALSKGEMDKAAQELAKLETPEMDRKTQKAVTEKLDQAQKNAGAKKSSEAIKDAAQKMAQGVSSGDKSKFQDGAKSLASECKKQGQKKKLADLLKKQCQCLGECKSECESECRMMAQGNKPGGKKAGKGAGGNPQGEKTARNKTQKEMKITGTDSGKGDSETENETAPEQSQEAVRQYQQNADKYEALSESALESESIPLGHRQTIRRYFELIRPTGSEMDAVKEKAEGQK